MGATGPARGSAGRPVSRPRPFSPPLPRRSPRSRRRLPRSPCRPPRPRRGPAVPVATAVPGPGPEGPAPVPYRPGRGSAAVAVRRVAAVGVAVLGHLADPGVHLGGPVARRPRPRGGTTNRVSASCPGAYGPPRLSASRTTSTPVGRRGRSARSRSPRAGTAGPGSARSAGGTATAGPYRRYGRTPGLPSGSRSPARRSASRTPSLHGQRADGQRVQVALVPAAGHRDLRAHAQHAAERPPVQLGHRGLPGQRHAERQLPLLLPAEAEAAADGEPLEGDRALAPALRARTASTRAISSRPPMCSTSTASPPPRSSYPARQRAAGQHRAVVQHRRPRRGRRPRSHPAASKHHAVAPSPIASPERRSCRPSAR